MGIRRRRTADGWTLICTALVFFVAGSLTTHWVTRAEVVRADSNRVFQLSIYHAVPGKEPELESVWRDASKFLPKHDISVVGYWVPTDDPAWKDTFIYLVAHPDRDTAKKNWDGLHHDPEFRPFIEAAKPFIQRVNDKFNVDEIYIRPTDFSPMH